MKKRFSIWVREYGSDHDVELCEVAGDPEPIVTALHSKRLKIGGKGHTVAKYAFVRVVENDGANPVSVR